MTTTRQDERLDRIAELLERFLSRENPVRERIAVSVDEAAKALGISRSHYYALAAKGRLPAPDEFGGSSRVWVDDLLQARRKSTKERK